MRVLVIGASGYVGSRVIPELLDRGYAVSAGARNPEKLDAFWWSSRIEPVALDVTDLGSLTSALSGEAPPEAVVYLVHSMAGENFRAVDLEAAARVREAVDNSQVGTLVYVSGIIPDVPRDELSEHLASRLEVEEVLSKVSARFVSLRAAIILGAGSTSFELVSQLVQRLPITVVPDWMDHLVEPIAVTDISRAICGAIDNTEAHGRYAIGCGEQLPYPELVQKVLDHAGAERPSFHTGLLPQKLVSKAASLISDVPSSTVESLMESLREDMVTDNDHWVAALLRGSETPPVGIDEALRRAFATPDEATPPELRDPLGLLPGDPDWAVGSQEAEG